MEGIVIRPANLSDIRSISAWGEQIIPSVYGSLISLNYAAEMLRQLWSVEYFENALSNGNMLLIAQGLSDNILGIAETRLEDDYCLLLKLYVRLDQQGNGIGSKLLQEIEKQLPSNVQVIITKLPSSNQSAALFFRKRGFYFERLENDPLNSGVSWTQLRYKRQNLPPVQQETPSSSSNIHRKKASELGNIPIAIVTVSDTRTHETDINGRYLKEQIIASGHRLVKHLIVRDEPAEIEQVLDELCNSEARLILLNGGTGISTRDTTFDVLSRKLEKVMPGFGEIFRMLSYQQVGAAAMLSRATAGIYRGKLIISTPGSPAAVELAWQKLILPEIQHLAWEVVR